MMEEYAGYVPTASRREVGTAALKRGVLSDEDAARLIQKICW